MWAVCVRARVKGQDSFPPRVCFYFLFHQPADSARILTSCWASTDGITHHACWAPLRNLRTLLLQGFQVRILNTCNLQSLLPRRSVLIRLDGIAFHTPGSTRKSNTMLSVNIKWNWSHGGLTGMRRSIQT